MEFLDLLLIFGVQFVIVILLVWLWRYSNQRVMSEIALLESQMDQLSQYVKRLTSNQKKMRHDLTNTAQTDAPAQVSAEKTHEPEQNVPKTVTITIPNPAYSKK